MDEKWKYISGYIGFYQVSNLGNVRSVDRYVIDAMFRKRKYEGKLLRPGNYRGHPKVSLKKAGDLKSYKISELVAEAFIEEYNKGDKITFKDDNPKNVTADNLQITAAQQILEPVAAGNVVTGEKEQFKSIEEAAETLGVPKRSIKVVLREGSSSSIHGYVFSRDYDELDSLIKDEKKLNQPPKVKAVHVETSDIKYFPSNKAAGLALDINPSAISKVLNKKQIQAKGYVFFRI